MTEQEKLHFRNEAKSFGSQLLNLQAPKGSEESNGAKGKKSKKSKKKSKKPKDEEEDEDAKVPKAIKDKVLKQQSQQKAPWAATRAHLELS